MPFEKGNELWRLADPDLVGRPRKFEKPSELWDKAKEYFEHVDKYPVAAVETTTKGMKTNGVGEGEDDEGEEEIGVQNVDKKIKSYKRPYTWDGLHVFLGVSHLEEYKKRDEFLSIINFIGCIIRDQKLTGATAGYFNANIVARELGLKDGSDITTNGKSINISPIEWVDGDGEPENEDNEPDS